MILGKKLYLIILKDEVTQRLATRTDDEAGTYYLDLGIRMGRADTVNVDQPAGDIYFPDKLRQIQELSVNSREPDPDFQ